MKRSSEQLKVWTLAVALALSNLAALSGWAQAQTRTRTRSAQTNVAYDRGYASGNEARLGSLADYREGYRLGYELGYTSRRDQPRALLLRTRNARRDHQPDGALFLGDGGGGNRQRL